MSRSGLGLDEMKWGIGLGSGLNEVRGEVGVGVGGRVVFPPVAGGRVYLVWGSRVKGMRSAVDKDKAKWDGVRLGDDSSRW